MKWIIYYRYPLSLLVGLSIMTSGALALVFHFNPERVIKGQWKETGWSYEKIDKKAFLYHDIKIGRKHESESWKFIGEDLLYFYNGKEITYKARWRIKGRGHILQIKYEDGDTELYDIKELNEQELVLNFDIGIESRGIARLVFTKIANN